MDPSGQSKMGWELGVSSLTLGLFGLLVSWLYPLGLFLSAVGLPLGLIGCAFGPTGDRLAPLGTVLCATGFGVGVLLGWGTYIRLLGL